MSGALPAGSLGFIAGPFFHVSWPKRLADELKQALADYTNSKGKGEITLDQECAFGKRVERRKFQNGQSPGPTTADLKGFNLLRT